VIRTYFFEGIDSQKPAELLFLDSLRERIRKIVSSILISIGNKFNYQDPRFLCQAKNDLFRLAGVQIINRAIISAGFQCLYPENILLQDRVCLGHNNSIWAFHRVIIGSYTQTARDLLIISGSHDVGSYEPLKNQEVIVGQGCWVGARVTILGGVRIGKGCVIGATSLVNESIPDWSIVAGSPARVIGKREPASVIWNPFGPYSPGDLADIE
jgi:acetyltransferase-like isoleucine patch superfamily enzyme